MNMSVIIVDEIIGYFADQGVGSSHYNVFCKNCSCKKHIRRDFYFTHSNAIMKFDIGYSPIHCDECNELLEFDGCFEDIKYDRC